MSSLPTYVNIYVMSRITKPIFFNVFQDSVFGPTQVLGYIFAVVYFPTFIRDKLSSKVFTPFRKKKKYFLLYEEPLDIYCVLM